MDYQRAPFLRWVEDTYFRVRFWSNHYYLYMWPRLKENVFVLGFSIAFLCILYQLCFVEES